MNGYVVLFAFLALLCGACSATAWDRDRFAAIGNAVFAVASALLAIGIWGEVP